MAPGVVLCSGTGPGTVIESGVDEDRWLKPGDQLSAETHIVGVLTNVLGNC